MSDSLHPQPSADATSRSHHRWGVEVGAFRVAVTRTRETHHYALPTLRPAPSRARTFAAGALAGVGGVALLVVGANAAPRPVSPISYMVSVPVPTAARHVAPRAPRATAPGRQTPRKVTAPAGDRFDPADEPHVAQAMATGAFQQWEDANGLPRFLTAGPARFSNGRACRDLALLIRFANGGSHVRSAERCTTGPVTDDIAPAATGQDQAAQD